MSIKLPKAKNRPMTRTLLLVLLLAVAVATAWGLVSWKNRFIQEGEDILQSIRTKGLDHIWADEPRHAYHLTEIDGKVVGMEIRSRVPIENGFTGNVRTYQFSRDNILTRTAVVWTLNNTATTGTYQSRVFKNLHEINQTVVKLESGVLSIHTQTPKQTFSASQTPPSNYAPEGLLSQVITEVARRKTAARLQITFDHIPPMQGQILYASVFLRYVGPSPEDASLNRLRWTCDCLDPGLSRIVSYYDIDEKGRIIREITGPRVRRRTTPEELLKHFPEAADIIKNAQDEKADS